MKNRFNIFILLMAALSIAACSDENEEARIPVAAFNIDKLELSVGQSMTITFSGVADSKSIWTGDAGHDYYKAISEKNIGVPMSKNIYTYAYSSPGHYHVVCIANTADTYMGNNGKRDTIAFDVNVTDDATKITKLYSYVYPNTYEATEIDENNWVLNFPTKQVFKEKEVKLNATKQNLSFETLSDSTKLYVDGKLWTEKTKYNFTKTLKLQTVSLSGDTRDYTLITVIYPEFKSFNIGDAVAKQTRNAYYKDLLTYTLSLPEGTDPKNVVPEFVTDSEGDVKFYADGKEVKPGTAIDLKLPDGTYTLVRTSKENAKATATTRVRFVIE